MDYELLAELLFPQIKELPADMEARYPARDLPEGAKVTRFSPSPTGFVHMGGMYQAVIGENLAHASHGVFYLRIEDTDAKREVSGAAQGLIRTLSQYGIHFDEGADIGEDGGIVSRGAYGPYRQSERKNIYQTYAKQLVREGKAYPVFSTPEELEALQAVDKKAENSQKDWETASADARREMLAHRDITVEQVKQHLQAGHPFVLRIRSDGDGEKKLTVTDLIKGTLELPENDEDFVLLKSDGIPTYHFAHAIDDHLMHTTHVQRGEEWLPSLPKHLQLFRYLGFKPPKYLHTAQILRLDENGNKKKLSKRDLGATMGDYDALGYPTESVIEYLMTLVNSNYEEWRTANPDQPYNAFAVSVKKLSTSGCLFDFDKLNDVSKNVISKFDAKTVYDAVLSWAKAFDPDFAKVLERDPARSLAIFSIGRGGKKPRKDFACWKEAKQFVSFFFPEYFQIEEDASGDRTDIRKVLTKFCETYDGQDDANIWFEKVKTIADDLGYCTNMKEYKANPSAYRGSVGDVSNFLRVALTGRSNSPDLYTVMQILGKDESFRRIRAYIDRIA